jgi:alpha-amylase/alpha-mannosidase (GH57 family)
VLWHFQNARIIDILGTGYYHPVFPLIPEADRAEHLERWQGIAQHLFWRTEFQGFWPPEMGFSMELIPLLKRFGYRFAIVDSEHVEPVTPMSWHELRYRPHIARHGGDEIVVIVRDRDLSDAQESGMDYIWFVKEVAERTKSCDFEPLVTTCTDGENGGWFRNTTNEVNFWGAFYQELLDESRKDGLIRPIFIKDYLDRFGAHGEVTVKTGAWNTGWHHGRDFLQWTGSQRQKDSLGRIKAVSDAVHEAIEQSAAREMGDQERKELEEVYWRLLRAETSCNFFWGEDWVDRADSDLDAVEANLHRFKTKKYSLTGDPGWLGD